jgi:plasmid stabilization system protein ParE
LTSSYASHTKILTGSFEIYADKIDSALQAISENFALGHSRDDLPPTHLAYLVGSHVIIYRPLPNKAHAESIGVVRILHQRMNLPRHI